MEIRYRKNRAFTLIELMIIIAIIGILATMVSINLMGAQAKGRDAKRVSDFHTMKGAVLLYKDANNGSYPINHCGGALCWIPPGLTAAEGCGNSITGTNNSFNGLNNCNINIFGELMPTYIDKLPMDPSGPNSGQYYWYHHDINSYHMLITALESIRADQADDAYVLPDSPEDPSNPGHTIDTFACRMNAAGLPDANNQIIKNSYCVKL